MIFSREQDCADDLLRALSEGLQIYKAWEAQVSGNEVLDHNYKVALDQIAEAFRRMKWAVEE